jgi:hypothetical protein
MKRSALLLIGWTALLGSGFAQSSVRYENLGNPTDYVFHASVDKIKSATTLLTSSHIIPNLNFGTNMDGDLVFGPIPSYYTKRYWTGPRQNGGIESEPEDGWIGVLSAGFEVKMIPAGEKCRVQVVPSYFRLQVGHSHTIFPHFMKIPKFKTVKSDTFFEYLFLQKLGELVGEKDMPPLKGSAEGDEWGGMPKKSPQP